MWEAWVWPLGGEDPLEEGMATRSSIPAWSIPWTEEPGGLQSIGLQRVRQDWSDLGHIPYTYIMSFVNYVSIKLEKIIFKKLEEEL